tara:strand:+ start:109 stop:807 length:699 start_codon:yes stop_codon:yes gene_type:complete
MTKIFTFDKLLNQFYNFDEMDDEEKQFHKFTFMGSMLLIIYFSYFINTNYLVMILISLLSYIVYIYNLKETNSLQYKSVNKTELSRKLPPKYLYNFNNINNIYKDLIYLKKIDKMSYLKSELYMNKFLYLLVSYKYNYNNVISDMKLYRNEALNQLKTIFNKPNTSNNNTYLNDKQINKLITSLFNITENYMFVFAMKKPNKINNLYTYSYINHPSASNLECVEYSPRYSIY